MFRCVADLGPGGHRSFRGPAWCSPRGRTPRRYQSPSVRNRPRQQFGCSRGRSVKRASMRVRVTEQRPSVPAGASQVERWPRARNLNWKAVALALAGLVLTFTAPPHRIDLLALGLIGLGGGLLWSPLVGPLLVGGALPFFFFSRQLVGPVSVTPPGLVLMMSWLVVVALAASGKVVLRWPRSAFDAPVALFLGAALLSLLVTEYPLLSIRELRALVFEPVLFFWLLHA